MTRAQLDIYSGKRSEKLYDNVLHSKRLELKRAAARLAQAEYQLEALVVRCDFLEARCQLGNASPTEQEELDWTLEALPLSASTLIELAIEFEHHKNEMEALLLNRSEQSL
jgi:hypothetical protein